MAAAAPLMSADAHGARVYMRGVLETACEGLLRRLLEDDVPALKKLPECDGVQWCAQQLADSIGRLTAPRDPQEVARQLSETCGCELLLSPRALEAVARELIRSVEENKLPAINACQQTMHTLRTLILREEKLAAFFTDDRSLSLSLFQEIRGGLGGRYWERLRIQREFQAELRAAADPEVHAPAGDKTRASDPEVCASSGDPVDRLCTGDGNAADPEVHAPGEGGSRAGPEVHTPGEGGNRAGPEEHAPGEGGSRPVPEVHAPAAKRGERVDLAIGDRRTGLGFYINLTKNPKDQKTLQGGRDTLRAILGAGSASAPGNLNTEEENRVCYQIIFYTPDDLAKVSQRPEEMEKFLSKQSSWKQVINCYNGIWHVPTREFAACILEVRPHF